jgi:pimeloyl-[acyl-carrier protein] synthase
LKSDPALFDSAIEEALRYDAPKQRNFRRIKKTHVFQGVRLLENQMIFQLIGAANHDPRQFPDPDRFDIGRTPNAHLSFGAGIHFCLGATLARKETRMVLEGLVNLLPKAQLAQNDFAWQERQQFRGPKELWIEAGA